MIGGKGRASVLSRASEHLGEAWRCILEFKARIRVWFFSDTRLAALAWALVVLACAVILAWFFLLSPYGKPAAPVYAEF